VRNKGQYRRAFRLLESLTGYAAGDSHPYHGQLALTRHLVYELLQLLDRVIFTTLKGNSD
jgi:hypothetical protein